MGRQLEEATIWRILLDLSKVGLLAPAGFQITAALATRGTCKGMNMVWWRLQGLAFLHQHHTLHLDIKPDNIFLDAGGMWKIGDFGLAIKEHEKVRPVYLHRFHPYALAMACLATCWVLPSECVMLNVP